MGQESSQLEIGDSQAVGSQAIGSQAAREGSAVASDLFNRIASSQPDEDNDKPKMNGDTKKLSRKQKAQLAKTAQQQRTSKRNKPKTTSDFKKTELLEIPETQEEPSLANGNIEVSRKVSAAVERPRRNAQATKSLSQKSNRVTAASQSAAQQKKTRGRQAKKSSAIEDDEILATQTAEQDKGTQDEPVIPAQTTSQPKNKGCKAKKPVEVKQEVTATQPLDEVNEVVEPNSPVKLEPVTPRRSNRRNTRATKASPEPEADAEIIPESSIAAATSPTQKKLKTFSAKKRTVLAPEPSELTGATEEPEVQVPNSWEAQDSVQAEEPDMGATMSATAGAKENAEPATTPARSKRRLPVDDAVNTPTKRARQLFTAPEEVDAEYQADPEPEVELELEPEVQPVRKSRKRKSAVIADVAEGEVDAEAPDSAQPKKKTRTGRKEKSQTTDDTPADDADKDAEADDTSRPERKTPGRKKKDTTPEKPREYVLGPITNDEWDKIERVLQSHRDMNELSESQQIQLIQGSQAKGTLAYDLFDAILEELPSRKRWYVIKACRRKYHEFAARGKWTVEDEADLKRQYDLHPNQWKAIGEALNRLPEDCRDRWRNYLVCGDNLVKKHWRPDEEIRLKTIVDNSLEEIRKNKKEQNLANGVVEEDDANDTMMLAEFLDWQKISERLGRTRSRRQCMIKWKGLVEREDEKWEEQREAFRLTLVHVAQLDLEHKIELLQVLQETNARSEEEVHWSRLGDVHFRSKFSTDVRKLAWARLKSTVDNSASYTFPELVDFLLEKLEQCHGHDPTIDAFNDDVDEEAIYADLNAFGRMMRDDGPEGRYSVGQKNALMLIGTMSLEDKIRLLRYLKNLNPMVEKEEYVKWAELGDADFKARWNGYCKKAAWERLKDLITDNHQHQFQEMVIYLLRQLSKYLETGHDKTKSHFARDENRWTTRGTPRKMDDRKRRTAPAEQSTPTKESKRQAKASKYATRLKSKSKLNQVRTAADINGDADDAADVDITAFDPLEDGATASTPGPKKTQNGLSEEFVVDTDEESGDDMKEATGVDLQDRTGVFNGLDSDDEEDDDLDNDASAAEVESEERNDASRGQISEDADEAAEEVTIEIVENDSDAGQDDFDPLASDSPQVEEPSIFGRATNSPEPAVVPEPKEKKKSKKQRSPSVDESTIFDGIAANGTPMMKAVPESAAAVVDKDIEPLPLSQVNDHAVESSQQLPVSTLEKVKRRKRKSRQSILESTIAMSQSDADERMDDVPTSGQPPMPSSPPEIQPAEENAVEDTTLGDVTFAEGESSFRVGPSGQPETKEERKERRRLRRERKAAKMAAKEQRELEQQGEESMAV